MTIIGLAGRCDNKIRRHGWNRISMVMNSQVSLCLFLCTHIFSIYISYMLSYSMRHLFCLGSDFMYCDDDNHPVSIKQRFAQATWVSCVPRQNVPSHSLVTFLRIHYLCVSVYINMNMLLHESWHNGSFAQPAENQKLISAMTSNKDKSRE